MITQDGMIAAIRAETESLKARIATLELALHEFLKQTTFGTPVASGLHAVLAAHHATWAEYFRHVLDDFESETTAKQRNSACPGAPATCPQ